MIKIQPAPTVDADVIVIGAGPAGAATAAHLARSGVDVLLVDRERFPRDKVCGDFVGPVALGELASCRWADSTFHEPTSSTARAFTSTGSC